jgi:hypothetical protein
MRTAIRLLASLIFLLPANGCTLFRPVRISRQDSLQKSSQKASLDWKVDSTHSASRRFSYTDSSGVQFDVEIVPSGPFIFSAQAGFAGSASLVRLRGKSQTHSNAIDSSSENMQLRSSGSLKQNVKVKTETTDKQKIGGVGNSIWWIFILLAICLIVGFKHIPRDLRQS